MKKQLAELSLQRCKILKRIEVQRLEVTTISQHIKKSISIIDLGISAAHFLARHPALVAGSSAVILTLWRKGIIGLNSIIPLPLRFALNAILSTSPPQDQ